VEAFNTESERGRMPEKFRPVRGDRSVLNPSLDAPTKGRPTMDNVPVLALHDAADPVEKIAGALVAVQPHKQEI
jgi:hypothetical protein